MTDDIAPNRDAEPEIAPYTPLTETLKPGRTPDAPYGYKKDGTPAKQRGRPKGWTSGTPSRASSRGSLRNQIGGMLITFNTPLQLIPALQRDALDAVEINALAKALDDECQRSPRFRKYMENALKTQGGIGLVGVVGIIAGRRAVRHNLIPISPDGPITKDQLDALLGSGLSMMSGGAPINPGIVVPPEPAEQPF